MVISDNTLVRDCNLVTPRERFDPNWVYEDANGSWHGSPYGAYMGNRVQGMDHSTARAHITDIELRPYNDRHTVDKALQPSTIALLKPSVSIGQMMSLPDWLREHYAGRR